MSVDRHQPLLLTTAGRARLEAEPAQLRDQREPQCLEHLQDLRSASTVEQPDLYAALEDLARVQNRIRELEFLLSAEPVAGAHHEHGIIALGSRVTARDTAGRVHEFVLVSPLEAGGVRGQVSVASPVGGALVGRRAGDEVQVQTPTGPRAFTVLTVE